jgi:hypothetical protein
MDRRNADYQLRRLTGGGRKIRDEKKTVFIYSWGGNVAGMGGHMNVMRPSSRTIS